MTSKFSFTFIDLFILCMEEVAESNMLHGVCVGVRVHLAEDQCFPLTVGPMD